MPRKRFRANRADMERVKLRQRVLVNVDKRDLSTTIVGQKASLPIALAPIGLCGMQHGDGEILAAEAAQTKPASRSACRRCRSARWSRWRRRPRPFWFQVYVIRDRGFIADLIARAKAANCSALVLTVDLQVLGQRHRDIKNGMTVPPQDQAVATCSTSRPSRAGSMSVMRAKRKTFGNLAGHVKGTERRQRAGAMDPTASSTRR